MGGWLLFPFLQKIGPPEAVQALKARVAAELKTTFASSYTKEISLAEALQLEAIAVYGQRATGTKFLINPNRGWESPGLTETDETLDLLAEAGIEYVADWVMDEQPLPLKTRHGELVSVPYTVEINDVVMSAVQQQPSDEIFRRGRDQFDRLYLDGKTAPRVMAISIHPYLTGVPHRIKYLEMLYDHILSHEGVVTWTGAEILDWYRAQVFKY
jgi:peptidoglycan/xylan/chitin deacetylase (PgdA/CDA1 family)